MIFAFTTVFDFFAENKSFIRYNHKILVTKLVLPITFYHIYPIKYRHDF